ncbi:MAG: DUF3616 domain-containing protein [Xanthobacteraceae bacterium]
MAARHSALLLGALTLIACGAATAADLLPPVPPQWKVSGEFKGKDARINLSGAACAITAPPFASCLIVNDEENYAQFFSIDDTTIKPGEWFDLRDKNAEGDPDGEGAAYDEGFFYITGSHGRARNSVNKSSVPSYVVFRIPVDKATGKPAQISDHKLAGIEASTRLHDVIHDSQFIGRFFNARLDENGVNIEGIAVKTGRIYFGLRGPSIDSRAFILSVDNAALFSKKDAVNAVVSRIRLGPDTGIRDMAAVKDGILILSGPVNNQPVVPAVFFWNEVTDELKLLGHLEIPDELKAFKAETLLVLRDEANQPFRALIMFDGAENGAPTEYHVPR